MTNEHDVDNFCNDMKNIYLKIDLAFRNISVIRDFSN